MEKNFSGTVISGLVKLRFQSNLEVKVQDSVNGQPESMFQISRDNWDNSGITINISR